MIKEIWKSFGGYKKFVILCMVGSLIEVVCSLMVPTVMAKIFDTGIAHQDKAYIIHQGCVMIVFALSAMAVGIYNAYGGAIAAQGLGANIRKKLYSHVMSLSQANIDQFTGSSLITRLSSDVNAVQAAVYQFIRSVVYAFFMIVVALTLAVRLNAKLSLIIVAGIVLFSIVLAIIFRFAVPKFGVMQEKTELLNQVTQENIFAQRVVKAFVRHDYEKSKFRRPNHDLQKISGNVFGLMFLIMPLSTLMMNGGTAAILWFGGKKSGFGGTIGIGDLNTFLSYSLQIFGAIMLLSIMTAQIGRAIVSAKRIYEVLAVKPEVQDKSKHEYMHVKSSELKFNQVSFNYTKDAPVPALSDIDLTIPSGQFLAIVGSTGEGKSSLAKLIPRLYDATTGSLLLGNHDVREYSLETLREQIAMVPQHNTLFSGTIRENILWGKQDAGEEEIIEACKAAQAHGFIMNFPEGYDTRIEQGGTNVSGGQRQRLCIARALVKGAGILILDDSTSALDTVTEKKIQNALREQYRTMTILLIAQKISSVQNADRILVLDNGRISGLGTHEELLQTNQIYQEIFESQKKGIA